MKLSPFVGRFVAVSALIAVFWVGAAGLYALVAARWDVGQYIGELQDQFKAVRGRRVDLRLLRDRVKQLSASPALLHSAFIADSSRAAYADLQRSLRQRIDSVGGHMLSLSEVKAQDSPPVVAARIRTRITQESLERLFNSIEQGEPRLKIADFSIIAKSTQNRGDELEFTAAVQSIWSNSTLQTR